VCCTTVEMLVEDQTCLECASCEWSNRKSNSIIQIIRTARLAKCDQAPDATCHVLPTVGLRVDEGEHFCRMRVNQENDEMPLKSAHLSGLSPLSFHLSSKEAAQGALPSATASHPVGKVMKSGRSKAR